MTIPDTTGRFGTGFLTTYLLSKKLTVKGVFHDPEEEAHDFRRFKLVLDRDATDVDEMIALNKKSFKIFS